MNDNKIKAKKILLAFILIFLAMLVSKTNKSYADEYIQTVTRNINGVDTPIDIVYEYDLINGNAENLRIKEDNGIEDFNIPEKIGDAYVVSIGNGESNIFGRNTVYDGTFEKSFVLPSTVKKINAHAFERTGVYHVNLDYVEEIGDRAFANALMCVMNRNNLNSYVLDLSNVKVIGKEAFAGQRTQYAFGVSVAPDWFVYDAAFETIIFGDEIEQIGEGAFASNSRLLSVTIPANIKEIGARAFSHCRNLSTLVIEERPDTVILGDSCFGDTGFTSINIIKEMDLKSGVFACCEKLTEATINSERAIIPDYTFFSCGKLTNIKCTTGDAAPNSIITIGESAFESTAINTLEYDDIVKNVTTIGKQAFSNCWNLTGKVTIKSIATNLGEGIFSYCKNIETAEILPEIEKIPNSTYEYCKGLRTVTKPDTVNTIGERAFAKCKSLSLSELNGHILTNIITIEPYAFFNCTGLTGEFTTLPQIEEIGEGAFLNCTGLTGTLTITGNVKTIGKKAFRNCKNVENIVINSSIEKIEETAFYLTAINQKVITLPSTVTNIGSKAFYNLKEVFLQNHLSAITTGYKWYGKSEARIHEVDCVHTVDIKCTLPGVSLVAIDNSELDSEIACKGTYGIKLVVDSAYADKYPDGIFIRAITEGQTIDDPVTEEYIELDENNTYTFNHVDRNRQIIVQRAKNGTDLVLREYITGINGKNTFTSRKPFTKVTYNKYGLRTIEYNHNKYPMAIKSNDKITYTIRVYNEGKVAGDVNEIAIRIPNNLELIENNETNTFYEWTVSQDGTYATTRYLENKEIAPFVEMGRPEFEELEVVLRVGDEAEEEQYMALVAEITDGNCRTALPNSTAGINLTNYKKTEAEASSSDTYIKGDEDDTDFEAITLNAAVKVGYRLVINKIDATSFDLLNGAKFQLLDSNKKLIEQGVVENGTLTFNEISSYGEGVDIYYLDEVETPIGYKRTMEGMVELEVTKKINEFGEVDVNVAYKINSIDGDEEEVLTNIDYSEIEELKSNSDLNGLFDDFKSEADYIPIYNENQLKLMSSGQPVTVNGTSYTFNEGEYYKLMDNITLSPAWTPINFVGTFDGNNKTISNVSELFLNANGYVMNLNIANAINDGTSSGPNGFIAGTMVGKISSCNVIGETSATESSVDGFGGLVGASGSVLKIYNSSYRTSTDDGVLLGKSKVGGLIGVANGNVVISESSISGNAIKADEHVGGLIGEANGGIIYIDRCEVTIGTITAIHDETEGGNSGGLIGYVENSKLVVESSNNSAKISAKKANAAGIIGKIKNTEAIIKLCVNSGIVEDTEYNVGGIIGHSDLCHIEIDQCRNSVALSGTCNIGGIVGNNESGKIKITKATNTGAITSGQNIGGIFGVTGDAIIEDCSNFADFSGTQNVGGIVGNAVENSSVEISRCTNSGKITGVNINAGGIIGVNKAIVNVSNCENLADISGNTNIGGIIGISEPVGNGTRNTIVGYDKTTKTIDVYIKNKRTEGKYNLNIIKVDLSLDGEKTLTGAKFNIYDKDKNLIKEAQEVNEYGILTIDNIAINSLTQDIFYIEEVEAPAGYDILVKDLIRIVVNKEWDKVNSKYIINTQITMNNKSDDIVFKDETAKTGSSISTLPQENIDNVTDKINKTVITNCTNNANVNALTHDGGGIIGFIRGNSIIQECSVELPIVEVVEDEENPAEPEEPVEPATPVEPETPVVKVYGKTNGGGIAGMVSKFTDTDECNIVDCNSNVTEINSQKTAGGIVGTSISNTKIIGCTNYSKISSVASAGILGTSLSKIYISDCSVLGDVSGTETGGIVGSNGTYYMSRSGENSWYYDNNYDARSKLDDMCLEIQNCSVMNNTIQGSNVGAVICYTQGKEDKIKNVDVTNVTLSGNRVSGGICSFNGDRLIIEDCNLTSSKMSGSELAGFMNSSSKTRYGWINYGEDQYIRINNCNVYGTEMVGSSAGGIIRCLYFTRYNYVNSDINYDILITNCYIGSDEKGNRTKIYGRGSPSASGGDGTAGGIVAATYVSNGINDINIENCTVKDAEIIGTKNATGICGHIWSGSTYGYNDHMTYANIKGCVVDGTKITNYGTGGDTSGILGGCYQIDSVNVENCQVKNVNMEPHGGNVAGIMGGENNSGESHGYYNIDNCLVENLKVTGIGQCIGGMIGDMHTGYLNITNSKVDGLDFKMTYVQNVGGVLGDEYGLYECYMTDVEVKNVVFTLDSGAATVGGVVGSQMNSCDTKYENIKVLNHTVRFKDGSGSSLYGGIAGCYMYGNRSISNVEIKNIDATFDFNQPGSQCVAGIAAVTAGELTFENIDMDNVKIKSNAGGIGGIVSCKMGNATFEDITVKNSEFIGEDDENIKFSTKWVGGIIGVEAIGNIDINNILIDNCKIGSKTTGYQGYDSAVGGMQAISDGGVSTISNIKINNSEIFSLNRKRILGGLVGVYSCKSSSIEGVEITNTKITQNIEELEQYDINVLTGHVGGIVGVLEDCPVSSPVIIRNIKIDDVTIDNNCEDVYERKSIVGGIVGVARDYYIYKYYGGSEVRYAKDCADISDVKINNLKASGYDIVSGILGCGVGKISDCEVKNSVITAKGEHGMAGNIAGIAVEQSTIDDVKVTADNEEIAAVSENNSEEDEETVQYGVFSSNLAGGIAAINSGRLSNFTVENIIVKSFKQLISNILPEENDGEIPESDIVPVEIDESIATDNVPNADAVQARSLINYINGIIRNVKVINGTGEQVIN